MKSSQQIQNQFSICFQQPLDSLKHRIIKPIFLNGDNKINSHIVSSEHQQKNIEQRNNLHLTKRKSKIQHKINSMRSSKIQLYQGKAKFVQNRINSIMPSINNINHILRNPNYSPCKKQKHIKTQTDEYPNKILTQKQQIKNSYIQLINKKIGQSRIRNFAHLNHQIKKKLSLDQRSLSPFIQKIKFQKCKFKSQKIHKHNFIQQFDWFALTTQHMKQLISLKHIYTNNYSQSIKLDNYSKVPKIPPQQALKQFLHDYQPKNQQISLQSLTKSPFCAIKYNKKQLYIGQMIGNKKSGMGILITEDKCLQGLWKSNQIIKGTQINQQGVFKGSYTNGKREGRGQFQWNTGQIYVGDWKNGLKHGQALWINTRGDSYNGQWKNGRVSGIGLLTVQSQSLTKKSHKYKGSFLNFNRHGFGRQYFQQGDYFQGIYKQDKPNGQGVYRWKNGSTYQGQFLDGKREGLGMLKTPFNVIYKGQFYEDKPQGQCQIILQNGDIYYGMVKEGRKNGKGTLRLNSSNQILNGYWQDDCFINSKQQLQQ